MSAYEHTRTRIFSQVQHIYRHTLDELAYNNQSAPFLNNAKDAIDYVFNVLYPRNKPNVATPADLPTGVDTPNVGDLPPELGDYRVVNDDGDGKNAGYLWAQYDGEASPSWHKVADFDWGINNVISGLLDQTQFLYVRKYGQTDYDPITELPLVGKDGGQRIYGGDLANQHLTLFANNGDPVGNTGFVQFADNVRPYDDLTFDLGTATERFLNGYFGTLVVGTATMTITSNLTTGLITDTSGEISFDDENIRTLGNVYGSNLVASNNLIVDNAIDTLTISTNSILSSTGSISFDDEDLSTSGTLLAGQTTIESDLVLSAGSITSASGAIDFDDEDLVTTGIIYGEAGSFGQLNVDALRLDNQRLSITATDANLELEANGTGIINLLSNLNTLDVNTTGVLDVDGEIQVDDLSLNGDLISSNTGLVQIADILSPDTDNAISLGQALFRFDNLFLSNSISNGVDAFLVDELLELRNSAYRDLARTQPAQTGDVLFYDSVNNVWLASVPDTEIDHTLLSNLTSGDAGHTQFAMLNGRAGGQTISGGTLVGQTLSLKANSLLGSSIIFDESSIRASVNNVYDLGASAEKFKDLYLAGQMYGARIENTVESSLGGLFQAGQIGRAVYATDTGFIYVNNGTQFRKVGHNTYNALHTGVALSAGVDVSSLIEDARNCIWQVVDVAGNEEVLGVTIQKTATVVTVVQDIPLPAGNYRLMGIEL